MDGSIDWQTGCHMLKLRGAHILKTGQWADCHFLVGTEPKQTLMPGHKLILSMASPVFDAMFNGQLAEKNDPIAILDVQPDAFHAMLEYIYTDEISIGSMDKACELCYVAKKYMLPHVVERCTHFLWSDLSAKNVCRAYEFAILFEEPSLAERCLQIICTQTEEMLADPSFEEIQLSTLMVIMEQEFLQISSELDLFLAVARYCERHEFSAAEMMGGAGELEGARGGGGGFGGVGAEQQASGSGAGQQAAILGADPDPHPQVSAPKRKRTQNGFEPMPAASPAANAGRRSPSAQPDDDSHDDSMNISVDDLQPDGDADAIDNPASVDDAAAAVAAAAGAQPASPAAIDAIDAAQPPAAAAAAAAPPPPIHAAPISFRDAVKKIRFLTLTPKQFAENVARSNILTQAEAFAILMNISCPTHDIYPMPAGFSVNTKPRNYLEQQQQNAAAAAAAAAGSSAAGAAAPPEERPKRLPPFHGFREEELLLLERENMLGLSGARAIDPMLMMRHEGAGALPAQPPMLQQQQQQQQQHLAGPSGMGGNDARGGAIANMMETRKFYCVRTIRQQIDYFNTSVTDCSLTFTVDRSICITGIQVPTQVLGEQSMHAGIPERYSELLYAHLLDAQGARLTYTHCTTRVRYDSLMEISFDRPVFIQRNKIYKVGVAFNKLGWYPMCSCVPLITCETVCFTFNVGPPNESVRDGLIRAIVFSQTRDPFN